MDIGLELQKSTVGVVGEEVGGDQSPLPLFFACAQQYTSPTQKSRDMIVTSKEKQVGQLKREERVL